MFKDRCNAACRSDDHLPGGLVQACSFHNCIFMQSETLLVFEQIESNVLLASCMLLFLTG